MIESSLDYKIPKYITLFVAHVETQNVNFVILSDKITSISNIVMEVTNHDHIYASIFLSNIYLFKRQ